MENSKKKVYSSKMRVQPVLDVSKPEPLLKTSSELKDDGIIHPVTDDQIIMDDFLDNHNNSSKTLNDVIKEITAKLDYKPIKRVSTSTTPAPIYSSWSSQRHDDGYLQPSGMTKEERYPKIYNSALKLKPRAKRVLSFGCSTGEEAFALAKRFTNAAQIVGVDIDYHRICAARKNNKNKNVFFHDNVGALGQFDVVTALNVFFCLDKPIPKENWKKTLEEVAGYVAPGGVLLIFKSDHDPIEVLNKDFKAVNTWLHEHNRNKKNYWCGYYKKNSKKKLFGMF